MMHSIENDACNYHAGQIMQALPDSTDIAAQWLLGKIILKTLKLDSNKAEILAAGIIIETEAYLQNDAASHSYNGKTSRNAVMFGPPGRLYVYLSYGIYHCLNLVTAAEGRGEAVLIRSMFPVLGIEAMTAARGIDTGRENLASGPGKLCASLGLDKSWNGYDFLNNKKQEGLLIAEQDWAAGQGIAFELPPAIDTGRILCSPRIGISKNRNAMLRFFYPITKYVSRSIRGRAVAGDQKG